MIKVGVPPFFGVLYNRNSNRLGIMKEMEPQYVATFSEKPAVLEGHPFIVEAGVSLGGTEVIYQLQTRGV